MNLGTGILTFKNLLYNAVGIFKKNIRIFANIRLTTINDTSSGAHKPLTFNLINRR